MEQHNKQNDLFAYDQQRLLYVELCNAFYAREIKRIYEAIVQSDQLSYARQLRSLSYYVERAAHHIVHGHCPLTLDGQNGSWIAKQSVSYPKQEPQKLIQFLTEHAQVGLLLPVLVHTQGETFVSIDTIDQISSNRVHCNQSGWFDLQGNYQDSRLSAKHTVVLLLPNKRHFSAACCGHRWLQGRAKSPRTLSLREMLLSTRINWKNFKKTMPLKDH